MAVERLERAAPARRRQARSTTSSRRSPRPTARSTTARSTTPTKPAWAPPSPRSRSSTTRIDGEVFAVANVGDSRGYVLRHGRLRQVTIDHSFVQELVAEGAITRDEARTPPATQHRHPSTRHRAVRARRLVDDADHPWRSLRAVQRRARRRGRRRHDHRHPASPTPTTPRPPLRRSSTPPTQPAAATTSRSSWSTCSRATIHPTRPRSSTSSRSWNDHDDDLYDTTGETQIVADPIPDDDADARRSHRRACPPSAAGVDVTPATQVPTPSPPSTRVDTVDSGRRTQAWPGRPVRARARGRRRPDPRFRDLRRMGSQRILRRVRRQRAGRHLPGPREQRALVRPDARGGRPLHARRTRRRSRSASSKIASDFESQASAERFVAERLVTTTTTTTTTTTVPPTTTSTTVAATTTTGG